MDSIKIKAGIRANMHRGSTTEQAPAPVVTSIPDLFPLRHPPRPAFLDRATLRALLGALRDLAARMLRGRARAEIAADTVHAAARIALHRAAAGLDPGRLDDPTAEREVALVTERESDLEACAGSLARAALRLGRRRLRTRRGVRRA